MTTALGPRSPSGVQIITLFLRLVRDGAYFATYRVDLLLDRITSLSTLLLITPDRGSISGAVLLTGARAGLCNEYLTYRSNLTCQFLELHVWIIAILRVEDVVLLRCCNLRQYLSGWTLLRFFPCWELSLLSRHLQAGHRLSLVSLLMISTRADTLLVLLAVRLCQSTHRSFSRNLRVRASRCDYRFLLSHLCQP